MARLRAMRATCCLVIWTMEAVRESWTMVYGFVAMSGAIVAGFGGMAGLIATQL
jgi:hypothetical protein